MPPYTAIKIWADYQKFQVMPRGRSLISGTVPSKKLPEISGTCFIFEGTVPEISGTVPMFLHCYMQNIGMRPEISGTVPSKVLRIPSKF